MRIRHDATAGARALVRWRSGVGARIGDEPLAVLSAADEAAWLDRDLEEFRQALDRGAA